MKNISLIIFSLVITSHMQGIFHHSNTYKDLPLYVLGKKKKKLEHHKKKNAKKENRTFIPKNNNSSSCPQALASLVEEYIIYSALKQKPCVLF